MTYQIEITQRADADLRNVKPFYRSEVLDGIEKHLQYTPTQVSRSRIKRLRLVSSPAYRLRVGDYRVYYDVDENKRAVTILRVLSKNDSFDYLEAAGVEE